MPIDANTTALVKVIQDIAANTTGTNDLKEKQGVILAEALSRAIGGATINYKESILELKYPANIPRPTSGFTLIVGDQYAIYVLEVGDNFANVGYVSAGVVFKATGPIPTDWTNGSTLFVLSEGAPVIRKLRDEIEGTFYINTLPTLKLELKNDSGVFPIGKSHVYVLWSNQLPGSSGNRSITLPDVNTVGLTGSGFESDQGFLITHLLKILVFE